MKKIGYEFTRQSLMPGFDGKTCKVCPTIATDGKTILLAYGRLLLTGSDVGVGCHIIRSTDGGKTFSGPIDQPALQDSWENGMRRTYGGNLYYHKGLKKWFMLGLSCIYRDNKSPVTIDGISVTQPLWGEVDPEKGQFISHKPLKFPLDYVSAYSMGQIVELENGDILVPFNFTTRENHKAMVVTVCYRFIGEDLRPVFCGEPLISTKYKRGYCEPSLARLGNRYYLTLRTDEVGLYAVSEDGYHFSEPKPYIWEDGSILENYNTQQHWMVSVDGLFLAYTRKGAHNDHVFRHRAPIFMTRFDEERECLIRDEEVILVPELGARLGNFFCMEPNENEAWLVTAEWMQSWGEKLGVCEKYGSNNSLWFSRVYWKK